MKLTLTRKRVRSLDYIPYAINDWSSIDFALFHEREEDKKYNLSLEEYKKKCEELEKVINFYRNNLEDILSKRIAAIEKEIETKILEEEVAKAVAAKEDELIKRFRQQSKVIEQKYVNAIKSQQVQIDNLIRRLNKDIPKRTGNPFASRYKNECYYCHGVINENDLICKAKFTNGIEKYVHEDCCE